MSALEALDAIPLAEVTDDHVLAAVAERRDHMLHHGGVAMDEHDFFKPGDLDQYRGAAAWWPTDAPHSHRLPTLREMCLYAAAGQGAQLRTFTGVLDLLWPRCMEWLFAEGRDPNHPNESREERRRRQARESMGRRRAVERELRSEDPAAARVRGLHASYMAACRARKEAVAAAHALHDPLVATALAEWEAARAELTTAGYGGPQE